MYICDGDHTSQTILFYKTLLRKYVCVTSAIDRGAATVVLTGMRSSLGIRRICDATLEQVMHLTKHDTQTLRKHLQLWNVEVSSFKSYNLLLRALTHASISNWAERELQIAPQSLSANTLELLGDRVVGACLAYNQLDKSFTGSISRRVGMMAGNRGLALAASRMGIGKLMRWEKAHPKRARERVKDDGKDDLTCVRANVETNGLAATYESIAGTIYVDGGFVAARRFVEGTIGKWEMDVMKENETVGRAEGKLREILKGLGIDMVDVRVLKGGDGLFYGVVKVGRGVLSVASHFSIEAARMAGVMQARRVVVGEREMRVGGGGSSIELSGRDGEEGLAVGLLRDGRWEWDGDYKVVGDVLREGGAVGIEGIAERGEMRERLRRLESERVRDEAEKEKENDETRWRGGEDASRKWKLENVCTERVQLCLEKGMQIEKNGMCNIYASLENNVHVCSKDVLKALEEYVGRDVERFRTFGVQVGRLWSVQRSMKSCTQKRSEVIRISEKRGDIIQLQNSMLYSNYKSQLFSNHGLALFALGVCARRFGIPVALAWLSGADQLDEK